MFCYYLDYKNSGLVNKDLAALSEKYKYGNFVDNYCLSLLTCHRIEFYSLNEIPLLEYNNFQYIDDDKEIYNRFFNIVLGIESEIFLENAIISQVNLSLSRYKNKNDFLFKLLSNAFLDAIYLRLKYNLFAKNHGNFAMDFILNNDKNKENIIFIGFSSLVKEVLNHALENFKNVIIVTRLKKRYIKGLNKSIKVIDVDKLYYLTSEINNYSLFLATTNINNEYTNILNKISKSKNCNAIGNIISVDFNYCPSKNIPYIDMYSDNMKKYINLSNIKNKFIYNNLNI